jgi:hypothetical protein
MVLMLMQQDAGPHLHRVPSIGFIPNAIDTIKCLRSLGKSS